ncbi:YcxB family protein [Gemmata sp. G18]|uniref:YcxB family protein n=1 Tax=Gemmata palustris TaxID=2822762 RepID=A0ABS5BKH6_9BACT|nr:YcxB family protein [Gemmata palustris]MBP3954212.1 YcxB family protein [Gemmata palustris]
MRIRYENTIDDFVALARFHNDHSPAARRVRVRATWLFAVGVSAITAGVTFKMWEARHARGEGTEAWVAPLIFASIILISLIISLLRMPGGFRRQAERQARRMYAEATNKSVLGTRELELIGSELISRSSYAESRLRIEAVERVVTYDGYTLIFISATTAHIIPHDAVSEGDPERFAEAINSRIPPAL